MSSIEYRCEARSVDTFLAQSVHYVRTGHYFYVRCLRKPKLNPRREKDAHEVDAKLIEKYDIARPRWRRERRNLGTAAGIHLLRYDRVYVFYLTKGRHAPFYGDHGEAIQDIRHKALKVFGYSIRSTVSKIDGKRRVMVRLDPETERQVSAHLLTVATWDSFRDRTRMEREFERLPYQPYAPVYEQLLRIAKRVNRVRRRRGFEPIDLVCVPRFRRIGPVFVEDGVQVARRAAACCAAIDQERGR